MFIRKPKLTSSTASSSFELLKEALAQYHVVLGKADEGRQLQTLQMDDIDFLEAVQLVEAAISAKIDTSAVGPTTTVEDVANLLDAARTRPR
jgi:hypothetical protein